jgi:hypothetical protein
MTCFVIEGTKVVPTAEALLIPEMAKVWSQKDKDKALKELAYAVFSHDPRKENIYFGQGEEVLRNDFLDGKAPNRNVKKAQEAWKRHIENMSPTFVFLNSSLKGAHRMADYFNNVDFDERDDNGKPVYKPNDLSIALTRVDSIVENINSLLDKTRKEISDSSSNKEINPYEQ